MKVLFSPSERKTEISSYVGVLEKELWKEFLYGERNYVIEKYNDILQNGTSVQVSKLFGIKEENFGSLKDELIKSSLPLQIAVLRYSGVAYDYLDFSSLPKDSQEFVKSNVIIFSNLLGPLLAGDKVPNYKLKQGEKLNSFAPEEHYKEKFTTSLDEFLKGEFIVDLRAGFYEKFYTLSQPFITCKFLKNGKSVSHWAKAYRGKLLRELSLHQPQDEKEFASIQFQGLHVKEIIQNKLKREYVFEIDEI